MAPIFQIILLIDVTFFLAVFHIGINLTPCKVSYNRTRAQSIHSIEFNGNVKQATKNVVRMI